MNPAYGYLLAFLIGASGSWYVEGLRWGHDVASRDLAASKAIASNVDAVNTQLIAARAETETIRKTYTDYKAAKEDETSSLQRAIDAGTGRLSVRATCPAAMPSTGTVPGRTGSGTAELEPAARSDYFALRRGYDQQYGLLQFCRSELRKRSARAQ